MRCVWFLLLLALTGCGLGPVPSTNPPLPLATRPERMIALHLRALTTDSLRRGGVIGRYVWSVGCSPPGDPIYWTNKLTYLRGRSFVARVRDSLRAAGYATDPQGTERNARLVLFGEVRALSLELCRDNHWLTGEDKGASGQGRVTIEWTLRDPKTDRPVAKIVTDGAGSLDDAVPEGDAAILERAVGVAAGRLAVDPAFVSAFADPDPSAPSVSGTAAADDQDDALERAGVRVGQTVWAVTRDGGRIVGTVSGRSRDRDGGHAVVLVDFDGRTPPADAVVSDTGGRVVGHAMAPGVRAVAAWTGLTPVVTGAGPDRADSGKPSVAEPEADGDRDTGERADTGIDRPGDPPT